VKITGTDVAYLIDAAADRANLFALWQTLWREGCGVDEEGDRCRRDAFAAALDYATTRTLPAADALPALARAWDVRWPRGLPIPSADLPNRDPFFPLPDPAQDPLRLRPPLATLQAPDVTAFVVGLAGLLDSALVNRLRTVSPERRAAALDRLHARGVFAASTFSAALGRALATELGLAIAQPGRALPAPRAEPASAGSDDATHSVYARRCALCHDTTLAHPPNFLHGDRTQVETRIDHCAERMYVRLNQASRPETEQPLAPMPPPAMVGTAPAGWLASPDFAALRDDLAARITRQGGNPQALLRQPYASLRGCLPYTDSPPTPEHAHAPAL
jgi:cytochrome c5